jgi:DNA-binding NarL/FixJ family response regulator
MSRPTILIADDHALVVEGLVSLLNGQFDVISTASDGTQLLAQAARLHPDVVVTDLSMPGLSAMEALRRLTGPNSTTKVIVLTMHADAELAAEAIRAGASGFLGKHSAGEELLTGVNDVLRGRIYLTPAVSSDVLAKMSDRTKSAASRLTPRQREVLRLIAEGRRMKEIAGILDMSTRTVESHKYGTMHALGVQTTAELVRYAVEHRLVPE